MGSLSPRKQGDLGELSAIEWLATQGYEVWIPIGHSPDRDLIATYRERVLRVQVKTTTLYRRDRWVVAVCTRGGNRSWNGIIKRFSATRCDWLYVLVGEGRRWFIPANAVEAGANLHLGGPKYSEFEIDPGRPLPSRGSC